MDNSILDEFKTESKQILSELKDIVEMMEDDTTSQGNDHIVQFAQRIDRIMGASQTIAMLFPFNSGLKEIGKIASLCKAMGYKVSQIDAPELVPLFGAFWADAIEALSEILENLENASEIDRIVQGLVPLVRKRLEWLSSKIKAAAPTEPNDSQELNDLLNTLFK